MRSIWTYLPILILMMASAASPLSSQTLVKRNDPEPILLGSGSGTYHYGGNGDGRSFNTLRVDGYLLGEIVVDFTPGNACGGSFEFWKEPGKSVLAGLVFVAPGQSAQVRESLNKFKTINSGTEIIREVNMSTEFGGMRFMAKECSNSYTYTVHLEKYERYIPPKPYPKQLGSSDYYDFRYHDYMSRHVLWGPTTYYKDFGEKYYNRFMTETYAKLSPRGQKFLTDVGKLLQRKIEEKLKSNPVEFAYLEMNNQAFRDFAFKTHPEAYCASGWGELDDSDRSIILGDIDKSDVYKYFQGILAALKILNLTPFSGEADKAVS
jgi:hypothetical protein